MFVAGDSRFEADSYTVDGISGNVAAFVDKNDPTHLLQQATAIRQVAIPATHADFGGKVCANFSTAVYQSSRAASTWNYLHNGPMTLVVVMTPVTPAGTQIIVETDAGGTSGLSVFLAAAPAYQQFLYRGGVGGAAPLNIAAVAGTPGYFEQYIEDASSPQRSIKRNGQAAVTGAIAGGVAGVAGQTLTLGGRPAGTNTMVARWRALYSFQRRLSTNELSILRNYIQADTGLTP